MQRIEFDLTGADITQADRVSNRLEWLHNTYGEGDDWDTRSWLHPTQPLTARWAFGNYQAHALSRIKFAIWLPDDIKLLYDIQWPQ